MSLVSNTWPASSPSQPFTVPSQSSPWLQWFAELARLKAVIDDRASRWFENMPLNVLVPAGSVVEIVAVKPGSDPGAYESASPARSVHRFVLSDFVAPIADQLGIRLRFVDPGQDLTLIDRLFELRSRQILDPSHAALAGSEMAYGTHFSAAEVLRGALGKAASDAAEAASLGRLALASLESRRMTTRRGAECHYFVGGQHARTLVLVNAFGQSLECWAPILPSLLALGRVVALTPGSIDRAGAQPLTPAAISTHADDLSDVLQHEAGAPCVFIGWCTGPKVILALQSVRPDLISHMIFLSGSFKNLDGCGSWETPYESGLESLLGLIESAAGLEARLIEALKTFLLARPSQHPADCSDEAALKLLAAPSRSLERLVTAPFASPAHIRSYAPQLRDFWNFDTTPSLRQSAAPILFIGGDCDGIASPAIFAKAAQLAPRATFARVHAGSHYLHWEQPELVATLIRSFFVDPAHLALNHPLVEISQPVYD